MTSREWSDRDLEKTIDRLRKEYSDAFDEISNTLHDYYYGWTEYDRDGKPIYHMGMFERLEEQEKYRGTIYSDKEWKEYVASQEGRGEYWMRVQDAIADRIVKADVIARDIINHRIPPVYNRGAEEVSLIVQKSAIDQGVLGIRFDIVDTYTLDAIMNTKYPPLLLGLDEEWDKEWNVEKLRSAIYQSILKGENYDELARRIQAITNMDYAGALRCARTAYTSAEEAGKLQRMRELREQGVITYKKWIDVHDSVPPERIEHWNASGQTVPTDEPFIVGGEELMYPCDPRGSDWNIQNCRCDMDVSEPRFISILPANKRNYTIKEV